MGSIKTPCSDDELSSSFTCPFDSLPEDLVAHIISHVASQSFIDLQNMKLCCKIFLQYAEEKYVMQRVCLNNFPLIEWSPNDKKMSFLKHCLECGNLESIYREGILMYFRYPGANIGLQKLKIAADKGHKDAKYIYGMICLSSEDDRLRKQGLEHLGFLRNSKCIMTCRRNVEQLTRSFWKTSGLFVPNQTPICKSKGSCKGWGLREGLWILLDDEDDDLSLCEYCRWDHELKCFFKFFNVC